MTRHSKREIENALDNLQPPAGPGTGPFMGLVAYEPPAESADYLLTSEGARIPRDTDVCAVFPYSLHPSMGESA